MIWASWVSKQLVDFIVLTFHCVYNQQVMVVTYFVFEFWQFKNREWYGKEDIERENWEGKKVSSRKP